MTDEQALLRAVMLSPDDDTPRLVYADYLDDLGREAEAVFIRVQIRVARIEAALATRFEDRDLCTDPGASWCPVCGDCLCPEPEDAKNHPDCPLHNIENRHHDDASLRAVLRKLKVEEQRLWRETATTRPATAGTGDALAHVLDASKYPRPLDNPLAVYRRGFVDCIETSRLVFFGNQCGCDGGSMDSGGTTPWGTLIPICCPHCDGSGHVTPASEWFREYPIGRLVLTDVDPSPTRGRYGWFEYSWSEPEWPFQPSPAPLDVPDTIWRLLPPAADAASLPEAVEWQHWKTYPTREDAMSALETACVKWGRWLARDRR